MQRVLALPSDTRVWWERGVVGGEALPCNSLAKCTEANKYAKSSESDFLAGMRERYIQRLGLAAQATPKVIGWKERLGSLFTAA